MSLNIKVEPSGIKDNENIYLISDGEYTMCASEKDIMLILVAAKQIPTAKTFGKRDTWQLPIEFIDKVKGKIEETNDNEFQVYEEQIEDVLMALHKLGFVEFDNDSNHNLNDTGIQPFTRKDLDQFKIPAINCDGWLVPPVVEDALKELYEKHNGLVESLSRLFKEN